MNVDDRSHHARRARRLGGVHPLDHVDTQFRRDRLTIFTPTPAPVGRLLDRARADLPVRLASHETDQREAVANPNTLSAIARRPPHQSGAVAPRGLVAMPMLNEERIDVLLPVAVVQ